MSWFRLYDDMPLDPKMRLFTPAEKWVWVCLLCAVSRSDSGGNYVLAPSLPGSCSDLATDAGVKLSVVKSALAKAVKYGLVEYENGTYSVVKWGKRQYKSDVSTARVRAYRERSRNVSETPQSTETETETDKPVVQSVGEECPKPLSELPECFSTHEYEGRPFSALLYESCQMHISASWPMRLPNRSKLARWVKAGCVPGCDGSCAAECASYIDDLLQELGRDPKMHGILSSRLSNDPRPWAER